MGEGLLRFYREKIKKEYKVAFFVTLFIALLIHIYKFTNTLPNHDSVYNYYSDQNVLGLGRWALSWACGMSSYYDLPWINGLFSCIFIALTVVVIVALFKIENPILIALTGALIAASPSTTETLFFLFTADGYMISMFLAALAVYCSRIEERRRYMWVISGICVCISCGIYQAYVSFALVLAVCYLMDGLLSNRYEKKDCFNWILRQVVIFVIALAAYYVIWKLCMHFSGTVANDYQGVSEVGKISLSTLINGAISSVKTTVLYFLQWDVLSHGFTFYSVLSIIFIAVMIFGIIISCIKSGMLRRKWAVGVFLLCLVAIIPFACMWHFTSDSVGYRAMMLQSLNLLFIFTALLYEKWTKNILKNIICVFLVLVVVNNSLMANISYFYMNLCYERTYAEGLEMIIRIHDLQDEYEFDKVAVIGDKLAEVQWEFHDPDTGETAPAGDIHILSSLLEQSLLFNAEHTLPFLQATFGLELERATQSEFDDIVNDEKVQNMECWPSGDSITVVNDILVIKLSD